MRALKQLDCFLPHLYILRKKGREEKEKGD
jgi:hypothetical protein